MVCFYTGIKDNETFKVLFDSFGTSPEKLIYCDLLKNPEKVTGTTKKHGTKRSLSAEQEFFLLQVRISVSHFPRIRITCSKLQMTSNVVSLVGVNICFLTKRQARL